MLHKKIFIINFFLLFVAISAKAENVNYLLQSITNKDKVVLLTTNSKQNILYINPDCKLCFERLSKVINSNNEIIVILGIKPINKVIKSLETSNVPKSLWDYLYSDTGLRITEDLKIQNKTAVIIAHRNGKFTSSDEVMLSNRMPLDRELQIWQQP